MGFANQYLEKQKEYTRIIDESPSTNLKFIAVIPCYNEYRITDTLDSLWNCERIKSDIEVIVVINSTTNTSIEIIEQNNKTFIDIDKWILNHSDSRIRFYVTNKSSLSVKNSGAGFARKIGMDEAIARFNEINNDSGVIISLDADTVFKSNYFSEIEKAFENKPHTNALAIYFEHPIEGNEFDPIVYEAITQYELYLRYYKQILAFTGFPSPYYTIGSCFAVSAKAYMKQGGMSRKQAGEDFYFLQKIFSLGKIKELNTTCVYPSPRPSDRVPFGTGPVIKIMIENNDPTFKAHHIDSFINLKDLFRIVNQFYKASPEQVHELFYQLPLPVADFLAQNDFFTAINEINANSSNVNAFSKRFFEWFNAFRVIKYLNYVHEKYFSKQELITECEKLFSLMKINNPPENKDSLEFLKFFRNLEKEF